METNITIITALIAGLVSLVVSLISYLATRHKINLERDKFKRGMQRRITERLYELRLTHYPKAYELTEPLLGTKLFTENITIAEIKKIIEKLNKWKATQATFVMSNKAQQSFFDLRSSLNDAINWEYPFNEEQLKILWNCKNGFRKQLRDDIGLLFNEDNITTQIIK